MYKMCDIPFEYSGKDLHKSSRILSVQQTVASKTHSFDSCPLNQHSSLRQEEGSLMHFSQGCGSTCVQNINLVVVRTLPCCAWQCSLWDLSVSKNLSALASTASFLFVFAHPLVASVSQLVHSEAGLCLISYTSSTEIVVMALKIKSIVHESPCSLPFAHLPCFFLRNHFK